MSAEPLTYRSVSLEMALGVAQATVQAAREQGLCVCVAVVGREGIPVCSLRMDGAPQLSIGLAADKAWSVTAFGIPTHEWWGLIADDPALLHGITKTPRLIIFGGGVPLGDAGDLIGAIGVSGGSAQQDQALASAGAARLIKSVSASEELLDALVGEAEDIRRVSNA